MAQLQTSSWWETCVNHGHRKFTNVTFTMYADTSSPSAFHKHLSQSIFKSICFHKHIAKEWELGSLYAKAEQAFCPSESSEGWQHSEGALLPLSHTMTDALKPFLSYLKGTEALPLLAYRLLGSASHSERFECKGYNHGWCDWMAVEVNFFLSVPVLKARSQYY